MEKAIIEGWGGITPREEFGIGGEFDWKET